jgi:putative ABC transport system permease protein
MAEGTGVTTITPRSRLTARDVLRVALLGLRVRRLRAALSALGIAIGVAAIVGVLGISESSKATLLAELGSLGNLLSVQPGQGINGQGQLPYAAPSMIRRVGPVTGVTSTGAITGVSVRRTDRIDPLITGGIEVQAADPALLTTIGGTLAHGVFLNAATARYPAVVLGYQAALTLGVVDVRPRVSVFLGGRWFTVIGVLTRTPLSPEIDRSALIGFPVAQAELGFDGHPTTIYVRTDPNQVVATQAVLARTADPANPDQVRVSRPSDAVAAQADAKSAYTGLFLALGGIALFVGGVGVANVMVIGVLERRTEIGLRRALGATRRHVGVQFLVEAVLLTMIGGLAGVLAGIAVTAAVAAVAGEPLAVPSVSLWAGAGSALAIGTIAGLYPALRATRLAPTIALRSG